MPSVRVHQRAQRRDRSGRFDSGAVAEPSRLSGADGAEHPGAQRRPVHVVVLRPAPRSSSRPCRRPSGHSLLHALHIRHRSRTSCSRSSASAACGSRLGERLDQRVGPAAGGVLLLPGGDVRRAHRAGRRSCGTARCSCSGRPRRASRRRTSKSSRVRQRSPAAAGAASRRLLGHRRRVDDLAGVQPCPAGRTGRLTCAHRLVELVAEDLPVELAAGQPVAVLAGVDPAVLAHQVLDLARRPPASSATCAGPAEVDEGADVQAADRAVPVEAGLAGRAASRISRNRAV